MKKYAAILMSMFLCFNSAFAVAAEGTDTTLEPTQETETASEEITESDTAEEKQSEDETVSEEEKDSETEAVTEPEAPADESKEIPEAAEPAGEAEEAAPAEDVKEPETAEPEATEPAEETAEQKAEEQPEVQNPAETEAQSETTEAPEAEEEAEEKFDPFAGHEAGYYFDCPLENLTALSKEGNVILLTWDETQAMDLSMDYEYLLVLKNETQTISGRVKVVDSTVSNYKMLDPLSYTSSGWKESIPAGTYTAVLAAYNSASEAYSYYNLESVTLDKGFDAELLEEQEQASLAYACEEGDDACIAQREEEAKLLKETIRVTAVFPIPDKLTLKAGETEKLSYGVSPWNATNKAVYWTTSNAKVATVGTDGTVLAKGPGTANIIVISADNNNISGTCVVKVTASVTGVKIKEGDITVSAGQTKQLTAEVSPSDATNKNVTWASADKSIATVDKDGKVTGVDEGETVITVTTEDGGYKAQCKVKVPAVSVTSVSVNPRMLVLSPGNVTKLTAEVSPANAKNKTVTWSVDNYNVATVDPYGYVNSISPGVAIITVTTQDGKKTAKVGVIVTGGSSAGINMYRLYNPNSGEHFYTGNLAEVVNVVNAGWDFEGLGFVCPKTSKTPVYRLYNPNAGDHHYTTNIAERNHLVKVGWKDEGIGWYADDKKTVKMYRLYNPNATGAGAHHYTSSIGERDYLKKIGWNDEGVGFYALK